MGKKKQTTKRRAAAVRRRTVILGIFAALAALIVILVINSLLRRTVEKYDPDIIIDGVFIGETDVSGMTAEEAESAVTAAADQVSGELIVFTLDGGREARATLRELGVSVKDLEKITEQAADYGKKGSLVDRYKILRASEKGRQKTYPVQYQITEESAGEVLRTRMDSILDAPENAAIIRKDGAAAIQEDVPGEALDLEKTVAAVNDLLGSGWDKKGGQVQAVLEEARADIVAEDLEDITDVLGTYSTSYAGSSEGRSKNIESGAAHINGMLLQPGEEMSASELTAPYTEENGYAPAPSYAGNEVVESMGGGICQVTTTLYNALLYAELEITERCEHSMMVSYVDPSRDAAVAEGVKDLKFKNNLENPVYIGAEAGNGTITFYIYGKEYRPSGRTVEYESETLETIEPEHTTYVAVAEKIGTMYTESEGTAGHTAQLWKIVTENGEEISREAVNYSYYLATDRVVAVGTASDDAEETAQMEEAVNTQDEETITAVMNRIAEKRGQKEGGGTQDGEDTDGSGGTEEETDGKRVILHRRPGTGP